MLLRVDSTGDGIKDQITFSMVDQIYNPADGGNSRFLQFGMDEFDFAMPSSEPSEIIFRQCQDRWREVSPVQDGVDGTDLFSGLGQTGLVFADANISSWTTDSSVGSGTYEKIA